MDRVIKFRGKLKLNKQWIFGGYLAPDQLGGFWEDGKLWTAEVYPETVGQFTGFKDIDGKEIFEGDIIQNTEHTELIYCVEMIGGCWSVDYQDDGDFECVVLNWLLSMAPFKVIGNIHDNPELLEGGKVDD